MGVFLQPWLDATKFCEEFSAWIWGSKGYFAHDGGLKRDGYGSIFIIFVEGQHLAFSRIEGRTSSLMVFPFGVLVTELVCAGPGMGIF
jgi:hypothetical protein